MTQTLTNEVTKNIIRKLMHGEDYRIEVVTLINAVFLQYAIDFFKKIIDAKLKNTDITVDWYKKEFLNEKLTSTEIAINSGLNKKTISNMYNSATKEIVIDASNEHYEQLSSAIQALVTTEKELDLKLIIKLKGVSVDLNISESLIVINTLAVKRAALRGGLWSTAGKRVEGPLMLTLCKLYSVSEDNYSLDIVGGGKASYGDFEREIDFFLKNNEIHKCEVKLMGKGNPESADVFIARESKIFVADKLSEKNKKQFDSLGAQWVELRDHNGYKRFKLILENLKINHKDFSGSLDKNLDKIFNEIFTTN